MPQSGFAFLREVMEILIKSKLLSNLIYLALLRAGGWCSEVPCNLNCFMML